MSESSYYIDIGSIRRAFPPGKDVPSLLLDFAEGLDGCPWGSVGCFDLAGDFSDRAPIVDGSPLRDKFALFARLPEGSVVGAWYGAGQGTDAPIVVLGSEGQYEILAPSLESWLARIALAVVRRKREWTDFTPHEDVDDATDELAEWLRERLGVDDLEPLTQAPRTCRSSARWMEKWCRDREAFWEMPPDAGRACCKTDCAPGQPARIRGIAPISKWRYRVAISGARATPRPQPIEEAAAIEPLLRGLREEMWRAKPELGLWYSMSFAMNAIGRILPRFDYETRPTIDDGPSILREAKADLLRAPRPERWVPVWLTEA